MRSRFVLAALALALAACSDPTLPTDEWIQARAAGSATLAITNRGDAPVYVQVSDPTEFILMRGCSPETCARIDPGETLRVPYSDITSYDAGDEHAAVNWWVFAGDGTTRDTGTVVTEI